MEEESTPNKTSDQQDISEQDQDFQCIFDFNLNQQNNIVQCEQHQEKSIMFCLESNCLSNSRFMCTTCIVNEDSLHRSGYNIHKNIPLQKMGNIFDNKIGNLQQLLEKEKNIYNQQLEKQEQQIEQKLQVYKSLKGIFLKFKTFLKTIDEEKLKNIKEEQQKYNNQSNIYQLQQQIQQNLHNKSFDDIQNNIQSQNSLKDLYSLELNENQIQNIEQSLQQYLNTNNNNNDQQLNFYKKYTSDLSQLYQRFFEKIQKLSNEFYSQQENNIQQPENNYQIQQQQFQKQQPQQNQQNSIYKNNNNNSRSQIEQENQQQQEKQEQNIKDLVMLKKQAAAKYLQNSSNIAPDSIPDYKICYKNDKDRTCYICHESADKIELWNELGPLYTIPVINHIKSQNKTESSTYYIHYSCIIWNSTIAITDRNKFKNLKITLENIQLKICKICNKTNAGVPCSGKKCTNTYHIKCAMQEYLDDSDIENNDIMSQKQQGKISDIDNQQYVIYCKSHKQDSKEKKQQQLQQNHLQQQQQQEENQEESNTSYTQSQINNDSYLSNNLIQMSKKIKKPKE